MCRALRLCLLGATALGICGCANGGTGAPIEVPGMPKPCRLLSQLAATADTLERAELDDPAGFQRALDDAVTRYVATVKELRPVAPANLREDLDVLQAAVEQHRFLDAVAARSELDAYAAAECGLVSTTTTDS